MTALPEDFRAGHCSACKAPARQSVKDRWWFHDLGVRVCEWRNNPHTGVTCEFVPGTP